MPPIEVDGVEVIDAEEIEEDVPAWRRRRFQKPPGRTGRQHFEDGIKRVGRGIWDYLTGEGDDFDRAVRMLKGDKPPADESDD